MNVMNVVAEARASALSLRASAKACTGEQGALKFRLTRAAESLDAMVLLAVGRLDRIEQLQQQLTEGGSKSVEPAEMSSHSARSTPIPDDTPSSAVIVVGVDVAPLALAARIVQEVFTDLKASSVRGVP